jgi:ferredoxin-NADP reductase
VADGVLALTLADPCGAELPRWNPGAHIDLVLGDELTRQYSLCGRIGDTGSWRIAVLRAPDSRGGSARVHQLAAGSTIRARGPRNHFPVTDSPAYLFLAGGIGITPLLPMIRALEAAGADWSLLYGGRRRASMAFLDELSAHGDKVTVWPQDERGLLDLAALLGTPAQDTAVYCCGPEPLLAAVEERCAAWPHGALHLERFAPKPGALDGPSAAFEIVLERSGTTLRVGPDETIVEVLEAAGHDVPTSCREGTCGTCETEVLDGEVDHRDSFLTDDDREFGGTMMICCSRAQPGSRLVLDL